MLRVDDSEQVGSELGASAADHLGRKVDNGDAEPGLGQRASEVAGAAADVEQRAADGRAEFFNYGSEDAGAGATAVVVGLCPGVVVDAHSETIIPWPIRT